MNEIQILIILLLLGALGLQLWLNLRQARALSQARERVPDSFAQTITLADHQKAVRYSLAKLRLGSLNLLVETLLVAVLTIGGGIQALDSVAQTLVSGDMTRALLLIFTVLVINGLVSLPFSIFKTFVIESRFGFNKTTFATFVLDLFKIIVLSLLFLTPLLWVILWFMAHVGLWWAYATATVIGFSLMMSWLYPTLIAPLFNRFTPLEDPELKGRINRLMRETGFHARGIYLMDGSRRSAHGNAYFTGLGHNKRVVFFDTLLKQLSPDEIEAVLAHELGHFTKKHILKGMLLSALMTTLGFLLLAWLVEWPAFYQLARIENPSNYTALLLFMLLSPYLMVWITPLFNGISRRHEYEADTFAAQHAQSGDLIQALLKMYRDNASPVVTDALYSLFHDSHPPASLRIQHLQTH
jgi:STE24 endopeptidase